MFESDLRTLGDRWARFEYADELAAREARFDGQSFGLGFQAAHHGDRFVIESRPEGLDPDCAVAAGDEIIALDRRRIDRLAYPDLARYWLGDHPFRYTLEARHDNTPVVCTGEAIRGGTQPCPGRCTARPPTCGSSALRPGAWSNPASLSGDRERSRNRAHSRPARQPRRPALAQSGGLLLQAWPNRGLVPRARPVRSARHRRQRRVP